VTNSTGDAQSAAEPRGISPMPTAARIGALVTHLDKVQVINLSGEFDVTSHRSLVEALEGLSGIMVADLTAVTFLDSTAVGVLISTTRQLRTVGGDLVLVVTSSQVQRVLAVTQLDRYFSVFADLPSAVAAVAARLLPSVVAGGELSEYR
jgi:anti-sigma B factor antagonist